MSAPARPLLLLIDGSHAVFRAFFAIRHLSSPAGQPTGAVYGFVSMMLKLLRDHAPARVGVCFDTSEPTPRHVLSPDYKANRPEMPEDLQVQWPQCLALTEQLGLPLLRVPGLEADDLIATFALKGQAAGYDVLVVSGDKDLMQLVDDGDALRPRIRQLDDGKSVLYDRKGVHDKWGVWPEQIGDLLAIMGDSADNIPGVRGIGEKGAQKLIEKWGDLTQIYANIEQVEPLRTRELLRAGHEQAQLARQLVELERDAQVALTFADLQPKPAERATLSARFAELGFKRLTAEYLDAAAPTETTTVEIVNTAEGLSKLAAAIRKSGRVALSAVTDLDDPERTRPLYGHLVGLALCAHPSVGYYLPLRHAGDLSGRPNLSIAGLALQLGPIFADLAIGKLGCGLKFEVLALRQAGLSVVGVVGDAMLASYCVEAEAHAHTLRNIAFAQLNLQLPSDDEILGKGKNRLQWTDLPIERAAEAIATRAATALRCVDALGPKLVDAGVQTLYRDLELPLLSALAELEWAGVMVDAAELGRQSQWLAEQIASLEAEIHALAGRPFNIGSPSQLGEVLFVELKLPAKKKTQSGFSTDQSVLEGLEDKHPITAKVLRWRQLSKLKSTYTDQLPLQILPATGRVHTWFHQAVAATGRLSSTDPNLQNIPVRSPEGRRIRQAFVAAPGCVLISADYSQIELRVMAHLANDLGLQHAFAKGLDIHRETAARIFGVMPELVEPAQRSAAKTINFGVLYGMGPQRLAREIAVTAKEAKAFIERYFDRFPAVHGWMDGVLEHARQHGEVRTLFGRRRAIAGLSSPNPAERAGAERIAINTPVQGTAADLIKLAMLAVQAELRSQGLKTRILLQVHDELLLEAPESEVVQATALVRVAMQAAGQLPDGTMMKVPLQVDVRHAHSWAEAH